MAAAIETAPGLFGKMPMLGDFISRRIGAEFVDPWDDWLSRGMACARDELGVDWLRLYLNGPVWRFVLRPGVLAETAAAGVMMPSVDAANRHFPLTIAAGAAADPGPFTLAVEADSWFDAAERLALSCLEPGAAVSSMEEGLEALGPVATARQPAAGPVVGSRWQLADDLPESLRSACPHILDALAAGALGAFSLWWTSGSDEVEPALLLFQGMPPADAFPALLRNARPATEAIIDAG